MRQINIRAGEAERIRKMDDTSLMTYVRDIYCEGYEDAKKDTGREAVDFEGFSADLLKIQGIGLSKKNYILKVLRGHIKHYDE